MLSVINQAGYAIAIVDFAPEASSLPLGLVILTIFSAAMLVLAVVGSHLSQKTGAVIETMSTEVEYQKAA